MHFPEHQELHTDRLTLREIDYDDWQGVLETYSDEITSQHNGWQPLKTKDEAVRKIQLWKEQKEKGHRMRWGIVEKGQKQIIGDCAFVLFDPRFSRAEIGFNLNRKYWNQGMMTEALRVFISHGIEQFQLRRLEALVHPENQPCLSVLTKLGFEEEGRLKEAGLKNHQHHDLILLGLRTRLWK